MSNPRRLLHFALQSLKVTAMTKILSKTAVLAKSKWPKWLAAPVALLVSMPALAGACCVVGALCCGLPCCD
jgi:hypothetical protein